MTPRKGSLAICSLGCLGLITENKPCEVVYKDGNKGMAYVGIHLTDKVCKVGEPWSSRNPTVVGHIDFLTAPAANKAPLIVRIENIERLVNNLAKTVADLLRRREDPQNNISYVDSTVVNGTADIAYAIAPSRAAAQQGAYDAGPSPDVWTLAHQHAAEKGAVLVQLSKRGPSTIVMVFANGKWNTLPEPEKLKQEKEEVPVWPSAGT